MEDEQYYECGCGQESDGRCELCGDHTCLDHGHTLNDGDIMCHHCADTDPRAKGYGLE